jgi:hypothetical protein
MDVHGSRDLGGPDSGADTIAGSGLPPTPPGLVSDIQQRQESVNSSELPDFDPAPAYVKDIQDGRIRDLTPSVHTAATKAPKQGDRDSRMDDQLLVARLAKNNFAGPEYDLVATRLVTAGYRYCKSWIKSGKMLVRCREVGRPVGSLPTSITRRSTTSPQTPPWRGLCCSAE